MLRVPPDRYPDAVIVPRPFRGHLEQYPLFNDLFKGLFDPEKVSRLYSRPSPEGLYFITGHPNDTLTFPKGHPAEGAACYDWFVIGETDTAPLSMPRPVPAYNSEPGTVRAGWLSDRARVIAAAPADVRAHMEAQYAAPLAAMRNQFGRYSDLLARKESLSPEEQTELSKIEASLR